MNPIRVAVTFMMLIRASWVMLSWWMSSRSRGVMKVEESSVAIVREMVLASASMMLNPDAAVLDVLQGMEELVENGHRLEQLAVLVLEEVEELDVLREEAESHGDSSGVRFFSVFPGRRRTEAWRYPEDR